jgi:hypothetical protein
MARVVGDGGEASLMLSGGYVDSIKRLVDPSSNSHQTPRILSCSISLIVFHISTHTDMLQSQKFLGGRNFARALILGLFASTSATPVPPANASQSDVCLTPGCFKAAAHVLNNLHPQRESIDPCENFDQCTSPLSKLLRVLLY